MRRFWLLVAGIATGLSGFATGVAVTLRFLATTAPAVPDQPIPATRAPAPEPVTAAADAFGELHPEAESDGATAVTSDDLVEQLAPAAAPLLVSEPPQLPANSPTGSAGFADSSVESVACSGEDRVTVFEVRERQASELLPLIQLTRVAAAVDEATNKLVVSGTTQQLSAVAYLLSQLDVRSRALESRPRVADKSEDSTAVLRLYHWPASQLSKLQARVAEMAGVQLASEGEIVAVNATAAQHREIEQFMASEIGHAESSPAKEAAQKEPAEHGTEAAAASSEQTSPPASIDTDAIANEPQPRVVVTATSATDQPSEEATDKLAHVSVSVASYRIASAYLAQDDLGEIAKKNKCVAALRDWLGRLAAGRFTAAEVDACIQLLLGLGLIAPAENRQLAVGEESEDGVRFFVNLEGKVIESETADGQGIQQVVLRPAAADRVLVRLARADSEEDVSAEVGKTEAALALVPSPSGPGNEPDVLLIVRPVLTHAAQSDSVTRR